jgi:uncharacterized protein YjiS (DUF1127 family)
MSSTTMHPAGKPRSRAASFGAAGLVRLADTMALLWAKQRSRLALAQLDDRMLRDIGIDRATAANEADQPIWR